MKEKRNDSIFRYSDLFDDHMQIAKKKFIEKYGREPTLDENLKEYRILMEYFYD